MSGGQWMAVIIVAIVMFASIIKTRHGRGGAGCSDTVRESDAENARLRHEVTELKERLKVLERIAVDKENTLAREIEELRDR